MNTIKGEHDNNNDNNHEQSHQTTTQREQQHKTPAANTKKQNQRHAVINAGETATRPTHSLIGLARGTQANKEEEQEAEENNQNRREKEERKRERVRKGQRIQQTEDTHSACSLAGPNTYTYATTAPRSPPDGAHQQ